MKILLKIIAVLMLLVLPAPALAHGAIFTYKYIDGDNLVMVTHNVHDAQAGAQITYNVRLYTMDGQLVPFQQARATVQHDGQTVSEQTVSRAQNDEANFVYAYPSEGNYLLKFVFLDQDKQVAQGEFPIVVMRGWENNVLIDVVRMVLAFGLGVAATIFFLEHRGVKAKKHFAHLFKKRTS